MLLVSLILLVLLCVKCEKQSWKNELLYKIEQTNSSYLCYYFKAKMSFLRKQSKSHRNTQLNDILTSCGLPNVTLSNPYRNALSHQSSNLKGHIIMYTHNGFGNQLYQIAFGYLLAASMKRNLFIADSLPVFMYNPMHPDKLDPNSRGAYVAQREVLDFPRVDQNWVVKDCNHSNITYSERRSDKKSKNSQKNMILDNIGWIHILNTNPQCIMLLGYWLNPQWFTPFMIELKQAFNSRLSSLERYTVLPHDFVIHIRCAESHYLMLPIHYYNIILANASYDNIWLVGFLCFFSYSFIVFIQRINYLYIFFYPPPIDIKRQLHHHATNFLLCKN